MRVRRKGGRVILAGLAASLLLGSSLVQAASVTSQFFFGAQNQLSDNSAEFQATDPNTNGLLDVGERIRGIFNIQTVENLTTGVGSNSLAPTNNELTGVFEVQVRSKVAAGGGLFNFTFGPVDDGGGWDVCKGNCTGAVTNGTLLPSGTMYAFFEDAAPGDYSRTGATIGDDEETALNGTLFWLMGFTGADDGASDPDANNDPTAGEGQTALGATDNFATLANVDPGTAVGTFNIGVSQITGGTGPVVGTVETSHAAGVFDPLGLGPCAAPGVCVVNGLNASGSILGIEGVDTPFQAFDNVDFVINLNNPVPEPASLLLLGSGLIGVVAWRLRRGKGKEVA